MTGTRPDKVRERKGKGTNKTGREQGRVKSGIRKDFVMKTKEGMSDFYPGVCFKGAQA
jgi:hypothetical protein